MRSFAKWSIDSRMKPISPAAHLRRMCRSSMNHPRPLARPHGSTSNINSETLSEKGGLEGVSPPRLYFLAGLGHRCGRDWPEIGREGRGPSHALLFRLLLS